MSKAAACPGETSGQLIPVPVWESLPQALSLAAREVHVWRAVLDVTPSTLARLEQTLSDDERDRVGRYVREIDQRRAASSFGISRDILARYLRCPAADLRFERTPHGKPFLADHPMPLTFNRSHSHGVMVLAVAFAQPVGIDVEQVRAFAGWPDVAARILTPAEYEALMRCPQPERLDRFYRYWTCKEAVVKALGVGMAYDVKRLTVNLDAEPYRTVTTGNGASPLALIEFAVGPDTAAALAVPQPGKPVFWDWQAPE